MPKADETHTPPLTPRAMPTPFYAKYGARLAKADAAATVLLNEVRAAATYLREQHGYSVSRFVMCTGLHKNSLLKLADPTWVPEPETLWDLDQLIIRAAAKRRGEIFEGETIKRGRPQRE